MTDAPATGKHRIRENIDALAIAVLMAVLMKYFAIEAYQIPTSSMQPTMMGSKASEVHDRILVDKSRYILTEPQRWEIAVFRYPIRLTQNYVKRIVGMPGDHLKIAGGNVYRVRQGGDPNVAVDLETLRRPGSVLEGHWRELFPARGTMHGESRILGFQFQGNGWTEDDGTLVVEQRNDRAVSSLVFQSAKDGGLINRVYDGYPMWIAKAMIAAGEDSGAESVQDVRAGLTITPSVQPTEFQISIKVNHPDGKSYDFVLLASAGTGRIAVEAAGAQVASSEPFPLALAAKTSTAIRFTHVDDRCIAEVDGAPVAELDCSEFRTLVPLIPQSDSDRGKVVLRTLVRGGGTVRVSDLRVERDLHYLPSSVPNSGPRSFRVPEGHYFMMGDNTQQSVDSRDWTAITVGATDAGELVDPATHPDARRIRGNLRAIPLSESPDPDENPVVLVDEHKIVFTDDVGEVWSLDGEIAMEPENGRVYSPQTPWIQNGDGGWLPESTNVHFVPREHIIGRPLATFWPAFPSFRIGFIR